MDYAEYIAEQIDKNISYSDYIMENLDKSINYADYIADNLTKRLSINKSFYIDKKYSDIAEEIKLNCEDILLELSDVGIDSQCENKFPEIYYIDIIIENKEHPLMDEVIERLTDYLEEFKK